MSAPAEATEKNAPRQWIYRNLTPWRIHASFTDDHQPLSRGCTGDRAHEPGCGHEIVRVLSIPALGEVKVPKEDSRQYNTLAMRRLGQIELRPAPSEFWANVPRAIVIFGWLTIALVFGAMALFGNGTSSIPWELLVALVVAVPIVALLVATIRELVLYRRFEAFRKGRAAQSDSARRSGSNADGSLEGVAGGGRIPGFIDGVPRHVAEIAVLIGVLVISVIGLGVAIHLTTQLDDLLPIDYGALIRLQNPFTGVSELALNSPAFWQLLVGHIAQWVLVSIAALAPAAMYFQFDRERLASVQRRWVQEVFRLDPTVRTVRDIEAKYGSQIESAFGDLSPDSGLRLGSGRRSPVIVATILLVVGWFLVISTTQVPALISAPASGPGVGSGGSVLVWSTGSFPVAAFFWPHLSIVGYAFLGSYVFTLFHVLRGYERRDLHPKSYNTIVVRILAAYALALVVGIVSTAPAAEVILFFVGFMPESALVWLREKVSGTTGIGRLIPLREPAPLTDLEGIDLYDRTRLAEEGINNVQGLAHADIVDLMSSTRISAAQLVDWTDQAILYLRVGGDTDAKHLDRLRREQRKKTQAAKKVQKQADTGAEHDHQPSESPPAEGNGAAVGGTPGAAAAVGAALSGVVHRPHEDTPPDGVIPDVHANLAHLRAYGIRTATDLLQEYKEALRRGGNDDAARKAEVDALRRALDLRGDGAKSHVYSIQTMIDTLPDEEWFVPVRNWRASEFGDFDSWYTYLDGHDWELQTARDIPVHVTDACLLFEPVPMAAPAGPSGHGEQDGRFPTNGRRTHDSPDSEPEPTPTSRT